MSSDTYKILFSGQVLEDVTLETAKTNLKNLLKASDETVESLFSGKSFVIKKDLDRGQADKYVSALNQAGLNVATDPPIGAEIELEVEEHRPASAGFDDFSSGDSDKPAARDNNPYSAPAAADLLPGVHCRQCGAKIGAKDPVCGQCGAEQLIGKARSKVVAALLAIFLGWLGAHRFYLGQWWGLVYFFFGLFAWAIAIIEGVVFLLTPSERWDKKYGNVLGLGSVFALIVGILVFIVIVGILAAIAIPQYHDYTVRAQVHEAMVTVNQTKQHIERFAAQRNSLPNSNLEAGLPAEVAGKNLSSIEVKPGGIFQARFKSENTNLNDKSIIWVPVLDNGQLNWDCSGGDLARQFRPSECKTGKFQASQSPSNVERIVSTDGTVEMLVPRSWKQQDLSEDAIVQLGNLYAEAYLLVFSEGKEELIGYDLKGYSDAVLDFMASSLENLKIQYIGNQSVNGLPALHYRIDGTVDNIDLVYLVAVVEGKKNFYQINSWSLATRFSGNEESMSYAIRSFSER